MPELDNPESVHNIAAINNQTESFEPRLVDASSSTSSHNSNVQFDDDAYKIVDGDYSTVQNGDGEGKNKSDSSQHADMINSFQVIQTLPADDSSTGHSVPRMNIVKKQLKTNAQEEDDLANGVDNDVDEPHSTDTRNADGESKADQVVTFMADDTTNQDYLNKRDLWTMHLRPATTLSKPFTTNTKPSPDSSSYINHDGRSSKNKGKKNHSFHSDHSNGGSQSSLSDDSILKVFRGYTSSSNGYVNATEAIGTEQARNSSTTGSSRKERRLTSQDNHYGAATYTGATLIHTLAMPLITYGHHNINQLNRFKSKVNNDGDKVASSSSPSTTPTPPASSATVAESGNKSSQIIFYSYRNNNPSILSQPTPPPATTGNRPSWSLFNEMTTTTTPSPQTTTYRKHQDQDSNQLNIFTIHKLDQLSVVGAKPNRTNKQSESSRARSIGSTVNIDYRLFHDINRANVTPPSKVSLQYQTYQPSAQIKLNTTSSTPFTDAYNHYYKSSLDSLNYINSKVLGNDPPISVCDGSFNCKLPKCYCSGTKIPGMKSRSPRSVIE